MHGTPPTLPVPPRALAARVGVAAGAEAMEFYLNEGARLRDLIQEILPGDWQWDGKRALDFGCGAARVIRHFAAEAEHADFLGCDIDADSMEWARRNLSPPFHFFRNELAPPLELEAASLDLVWAMSVFTHISDSWADWLAELHRVLAPDGFLFASFLGEGMWEALTHGTYREDEVGMAVLRAWDGPAAWVFHSEWWLREHWGRAFDVLDVRRPPRSATGEAEVTHSYILLRKRDVELSKDMLEWMDPREQRELGGLQTRLRLAQRDIEDLAELIPASRKSLRSARSALKARLPARLR